MKMIIDVVAEPGQDASTLFSKVAFPAIAYVSLAALLGFTFRFYDWLSIKTYPKMKKHIVSEMFADLGLHSYSYFQKSFSGSFGNKINDMARSATAVISSTIDNFFSRFLSLVVGAITMYFVSPSFAIVMVCWSVVFISISIYLSKNILFYSALASEFRSSVVGKIVDSIGNILNVKLFGREKYENQYIDKALDGFVEKEETLRWYLFKVKVIYFVLILSLIAAMVWLLIYERSQERVTVGDFALILTLTMALIDEIFFIANQLVPFSEELGTAKQAFSIFSTSPEITDVKGALPLKISKGEIVFDKVHFSYDKGNNLFSEKSVTILPKQKVGLVGFSGSGKSTFVNLILRFFDVDSGHIYIDGQDIKNVSQQSLREHIAMIPQDPHLFHRTMMENIRYGNISASDDEVVVCSKKAFCHEFIENLDNGYFSLVGERGVKLSGGQRQRVAIARAMLKNAPILILDEATSSLDSITENEIQQSLSSIMENATTLVIAHRLSTLSNMDRILVFDKGKIVEDGTHSELLEQGGHYAKLWSMQVGGFLGDAQLSED